MEFQSGQNCERHTMFEIHKNTARAVKSLQKHCSKCSNVTVKMEKYHAHDENEQPLCRNAMHAENAGQNRNVMLKMLKLCIMLKIHNQNEETLLCSECTNVILKMRAQMQ